MDNRIAALLFLVVSLPSAPAAHGWGDRTHRFLTRAAVKSLPVQAAEYYEPHVDLLERRCLEPDSVLRPREGRKEAVRHFIDLDAHMAAPFNGFPRMFDEAVRRFGRRKVEQNGVLPWVILRFRRQLRDAIVAGDTQAAMREAGYLSHYVADAFQPLHLTMNHDGQKSNARGLHRRYENGLVDARIERYAAAALQDLAGAKIMSDPRDPVFDHMFRTYEIVDAVLSADRVAARRERRGSTGYYSVLDAELSTVTIRQLSSAASMIGSFWLTAWQEAQSAKRGSARQD